MDERFSKDARITEGWEYQRVKNEGAVQRGRLTLLSFLRVDEKVPARVGIIVSKRVGNAVVRNKVKRRLREVCRKERLLLEPGLRLVVVARPSAASATFEEMREDWLRSAKRAAIFATPK